MRSSKLILTLALVLFGLSAAAQRAAKPKMIRSQNIDVQDVKSVLESMGVDMFSFDLTDFTKEPHSIVLYVDEYRRDSTVKEYLTIPVKSTIRYIDFFDKKDWAAVRQRYNMGKNDRIVSTVDQAKLYFMPVPLKDSLIKVSVKFNNYGSMSRQLKLVKVVSPNYSTYFYSLRPFKFTQVKDGQKTPLLLYGSGWYDPNANIVRMCGESEIDPDMSSDILAKLPHYYVIGIKVEKTSK